MYEVIAVTENNGANLPIGTAHDAVTYLSLVELVKKKGWYGVRLRTPGVGLVTGVMLCDYASAYVDYLRFG